MTQPKPKKRAPKKGEALDRVLNAGEMLSNVCFNLKQQASIPAEYREMMERVQKHWDKARREFRALSKPQPRRRK